MRRTSLPVFGSQICTTPEGYPEANSRPAAPNRTSTRLAVRSGCGSEGASREETGSALPADSSTRRACVVEATGTPSHFSETVRVASPRPTLSSARTGPYSWLPQQRPLNSKRFLTGSPPALTGAKVISPTGWTPSGIASNPTLANVPAPRPRVPTARIRSLARFRRSVGRASLNVTSSGPPRWTTGADLADAPRPRRRPQAQRPVQVDRPVDEEVPPVPPQVRHRCVDRERHGVGLRVLPGGGLEVLPLGVVAVHTAAEGPDEDVEVVVLGAAEGEVGDLEGVAVLGGAALPGEDLLSGVCEV